MTQSSSTSSAGQRAQPRLVAWGRSRIGLLLVGLLIGLIAGWTLAVATQRWAQRYVDTLAGNEQFGLSEGALSALRILRVEPAGRVESAGRPVLEVIAEMTLGTGPDSAQILVAQGESAEVTRLLERGHVLVLRSRSPLNLYLRPASTADRPTHYSLIFEGGAMTRVYAPQ